MKFVLVFIFLGSQVLAGGIYSYVDENGVRVFTNLGARRSAAPDTVSDLGTGTLSGDYAHLIRESSSRHGVNEELVQAIIGVESNFDPYAISSKNCKGLMQLHPDTARRFGVQDIFDPAENIEGGVRYLSYLMDFFERDLDHVLAAYNAGENAVKRHGGIPPYRETIAYVDKVKKRFGRELDPLTEASVRSNRILRTVDADGYIVFSNSE